MTEPLMTDPGTRRRRGLRPFVLFFVIVAVLGGAGWSIWNSVRDDVMRAWAERRIEASRLAQSAAVGPAPAPGVDQPIRDDETANWTELAIYHAGANRPKPVLVVRRAAQAIVFNDGVLRGLVTREIIRQAMILAAREGTDAVVRDLAVGDPDEPGTPDATYRLGSFIMVAKHASAAVPKGARIALVQGTGPDRKILWSRTLDMVGFQFPDFEKLVIGVKGLAEQEFRQILLDWKLPPSPTPRPSVRPDDLPAGIEPRLVALAETEQFAAIRELHAAIRRDGGSAARWLALARGYAMLGSLTESLVGTDHAVYKARSLLYARLGVDAAQSAPASLRIQAFAEALAGVFIDARVDLDAADKLDGGKGADLRTETLRAFLASDADALARLASRSRADLLPLYLRAIVRSRLSGMIGDKDRACRQEVVDAAEEVVGQVPDCHRIIDVMCDVGGVSNLHRSTTIDLEPFAATSARRVAALPGLPPAVAARFNDGGETNEVALRQALVQAAVGDTNDLSWGVLAQLLREIRFLQMARRIHFLAFPLGSGASEFVGQARSVLLDHPNRAYFELFSGRLDRDEVGQLIDRLDLADFQRKNYSLFHVIKTYDQQRSNTLYQRGVAQADMGLIPNFERTARGETTPAGRTMWGRALLFSEPSSPVARAVLVEADWATAAPKVADWEREQPWNTVLLAEYAARLAADGKFAEAQPRFEAALKRSPEAWIFLGLAQCYREQKQTDAWIKAAQSLLEQPDQGLDHAAVADNLARYLMEQGDPDRAWPWAERGAQSWASWAMQTASRCAEMRRDWPNAEAWVARNTQRYDNQWLDWLTWCLRTEHGHPDQAAQFVWAMWDAGRRGDSRAEYLWLADLGLVLDRVDVARKSAENLLQTEPQATDATFRLALVCHRLGDRAARDRALDQIGTEPRPSGPKTARIITSLVEGHKQGDAAKLDLAPVDAIIATIPVEARSPTQMTVGLLLNMYGRTDAAIPYLKQADEAGTLTASSRLLVRQILKARGEPLADPLFSAPKPPKP